MTVEFNDILLYTDANGKVKIEVIFEEETFWLSQKKMAELFDVSLSTINEHLQNIFKSNELNENSVIRKFRITAADGKNYNTNFYNLDAIIAVGYRVNSQRATQFRIWATATLKEFIIKGFVLNEYAILQNAGKISHAVAAQLAHQEYEKFRVVQDKSFESDFDKSVKKMMSKK
jgi:hypothetical protein